MWLLFLIPKIKHFFLKLYLSLPRTNNSIYDLIYDSNKTSTCHHTFIVSTLTLKLSQYYYISHQVNNNHFYPKPINLSMIPTMNESQPLHAIKLVLYICSHLNSPSIIIRYSFVHTYQFPTYLNFWSWPLAILNILIDDGFFSWSSNLTSLANVLMTYFCNPHILLFSWQSSFY